MYITTFLLYAGFEVSCPKPGPDVGILINGQRIWFEATAPGRGASINPDVVPRIVDGVAQEVPTDRILLRLAQAVKGKCGRQYGNWLQKGIVSRKDCYIVAVNTRDMSDFRGDGNPPWLLRIAYRIGSPYFAIDLDDGDRSESGYLNCGAILRTTGVQVETGLFLNSEYDILSGLLTSYVDASNPPNDNGPFDFAPNPLARAKLPTDFKLSGKCYNAFIAGEKVKVDVNGVNWR